MMGCFVMVLLLLPNDFIGFKLKLKIAQAQNKAKNDFKSFCVNFRVFLYLDVAAAENFLGKFLK